MEERCVRVLEVDSQSSLLDLHYAILDSVDFEPDHLFEFYIGPNVRKRGRVFIDGGDYDDFLDTFSNIKLEELYPLPKGWKLYYWFDFGDDWRFEIRKSRKKAKEADPYEVYPRVIESVGPNPEQYPEGRW